MEPRRQRAQQQRDHSTPEMRAHRATLPVHAHRAEILRTTSTSCDPQL